MASITICDLCKRPLDCDAHEIIIDNGYVAAEVCIQCVEELIEKIEADYNFSPIKNNKVTKVSKLKKSSGNCDPEAIKLQGGEYKIPSKTDRAKNKHQKKCSHDNKRITDNGSICLDCGDYFND